MQSCVVVGKYSTDVQQKQPTHPPRHARAEMESKINSNERHHGPIPSRYLLSCKGDIAAASKKWSETLEWRKKERIDSLLEEPQPNFDHFKKLFPMFCHGRAKNGSYIWWEQPGKADLEALGKITTPEELLRFYIYLTGP